MNTSFTHDIMASSVHESLEYCDVCEDCDTRDHQNPAFDAQKFESDFQKIFKSQPRGIQTVVARWMHEQPSKGVLVAEVPTGGGKTRIGVYKIMQALQDGFKRGIYACATKSLQFQIANDAKKWKVGSVVCLYGKANYWCDKRLEKYLDNTQDNKIKAMLNGIMDMDIGMFPPKQLFENECKRCKIFDGRVVSDIWESITCDSKACNCYDDMWESLKETNEKDIKSRMLKELRCHHGLQRLRADDASLLIINMSLFLTYARHGIVMKPEDYLCIDEAHELAKWASNCFEDCLPRALEVKEMNEFLVRCGSMSPFSVNHIRQYDFPSHDSLPFRHAIGDYIKRIKMRLDFLELKTLKSITDAAMLVNQRLEKLVTKNRTWCTKKVLEELNKLMPPQCSLTIGLYEHVCNVMGGVEVSNDYNGWLKNARGAVQTYVDSVANETQSRRDAFVLAKHLSGTECIDQELQRSLLEIIRACNVMQVARSASDITWTTSQEKNIVPIACESGVKYVASSQFVADKLKQYVWGKLNGVLLMSATMASFDHTDQPHAFNVFCKEIGLDETDVHAHVFPEVFDKSKVSVCAPYIGKYDVRNYSKRNEFMNYQVEVIDEYVCQLSAGKSALVLSPSLKEISELQSRLSRKNRKKRHIMFSNRVEYDTFVRSSGSAIIYGSDSLSTGVDLPGRVGLVVITRPWNPIPDQMKQLYERNYLGVSNDGFWKYYGYRRDRKEFQAAGRLQRCENDSGTILFLGESDAGESSSDRLLLKWGETDRRVERPNKLRKM